MTDRQRRQVWDAMTAEEKRRHVGEQLEQIGRPPEERADVSCLCGAIVPVKYAYRCLECGAWWCRPCAVEHFGRSAVVEFARQVIMDYCWDIFVPDGGDIQDRAVKLGLIEPKTATAEDADPERDIFQGDTIYVFTDKLKKGRK